MTNRLFHGDNLPVMHQLPSDTIDLIYTDPPFLSGRHYSDKSGTRCFSDVWTMPNYLAWLMPRFQEMHRLLKPTGTIYVHLDWHAVHHARVEMDKMFGHLRNEIIWHYNSGGRGKKDFGKRHDTILRYSKGPNYCFNDGTVREPYSFKTKMPTNKAHYYDPRGKVMDDVWYIPIIPQNDKTERVNYPTQKPIELLQRIIEVSSNPGDLVADFFCGSGTFVMAAQGLRLRRDEKGKRMFHHSEHSRQWIACDQSQVAIDVTTKRLSKLAQRYPLLPHASFKLCAKS